MENGSPFEADLSLMRTFRALGVTMMGPVHMKNNVRCIEGARADPQARRCRGVRQFAGTQGERRTRGHAEQRAQVFYLPPYSPDMNPIEMAFSKLKALLRQAPARTVDGLVERIGRLLDHFHPAECANFFKDAGYQRS